MASLIAYFDSCETEKLILVGNIFELPPKVKERNYSDGAESLARRILEKRTASDFDKNQVIYFEGLFR